MPGCSQRWATHNHEACSLSVTSNAVLVILSITGEKPTSRYLSTQFDGCGRRQFNCLCADAPSPSASTVSLYFPGGNAESVKALSARAIIAMTRVSLSEVRS